MTNHRIRATAT